MANTQFDTQPKNGQHFSTATGSSARNGTAISADAVTVHTSTDVYLKVGGGTVEASSSDYDMHLVAGAYIKLSMNGKTHIAARAVASEGVFYINDEK